MSLKPSCPKKRPLRKLEEEGGAKPKGLIECCPMCRVATRQIGKDPLWELIIVGDCYEAVCPTCVTAILHWREAHSAVKTLKSRGDLAKIYEWKKVRRKMARALLLRLQAWYTTNACGLDLLPAIDSLVQTDKLNAVTNEELLDRLRDAVTENEQC